MGITPTLSDVLFADTVRFPNDTIDGETVLIDSANGFLYLFTGTGPQIWQCLVTGTRIDSLVAEVTAYYGQAAAAPTRAFVALLIEAQMLRAAPPSSALPSTSPPVSWPSSFAAPTLERYDQIADILSMDPIHQVDPAKGWPRHLGDDA
ncbi:conserved hypothetical protein [Gammaproteobacteria bacterium]